MTILDFHTHTPRLLSIVDIDPSQEVPPVLNGNMRYSVGIHPWNVSRVTPEQWITTKVLALSRNVIAIGETGLDRARSPETLPLQTEWLCRHVELSETVGKPLILHIVRCFPEIIALRRRLRPTQPWIIHGFRGKPQLGAELLRHGFRLSFGRRFNPESLALTPSPLLETDTYSILTN